MRFTACLIIAVMLSSRAISQEGGYPARVKVMTLGVFHFNFPNLDARKVDDKDKIDVLDDMHQKDIVSIVDALKEFRPTRIVVEAKMGSQHTIDSLYGSYLSGHHRLEREEVEQLGFRLAKELNLKGLECVDTWGRSYESLEYLFSDTSSRAKAFEHYYFNNPDTVYNRADPGISLATERGITENLLYLNDPRTIRQSLGPYLVGHFKYEETDGDYTGADFETGRWFNRNLRIFRNVQRIPVDSSDRILIIYGAGHLNVLNDLYECSPEYEFVSPVPYLLNAGKK